MDNVLFNYVVNGIVVEGPMPYREVLARTGLKDTVGLTELGYVEYFEPQAETTITSEEIQQGIRGLRNHLLQQSDWTQLADVQLTTQKKTEWAIYRQALRDMPETFADATHPAEVTVPQKPSN
jgi:hypothetical protein